MSLMWIPAQTTVPPGAVALSARGTKAPTGAKMIAALSGLGGAASEEPAQPKYRLPRQTLRTARARPPQGPPPPRPQRPQTHLQTHHSRATEDERPEGLITIRTPHSETGCINPLNNEVVTIVPEIDEMQPFSCFWIERISLSFIESLCHQCRGRMVT